MNPHPENTHPMSYGRASEKYLNKRDLSSHSPKLRGLRKLITVFDIFLVDVILTHNFVLTP